MTLFLLGLLSGWLSAILVVAYYLNRLMQRHRADQRELEQAVMDAVKEEHAKAQPSHEAVTGQPFIVDPCWTQKRH